MTSKAPASESGRFHRTVCMILCSPSLDLPTAAVASIQLALSLMSGNYSYQKRCSVQPCVLRRGCRERDRSPFTLPRARLHADPYLLRQDRIGDAKWLHDG